MPGHEVITRGALPHWYVPSAAHFVTYRLAGTLPQTVLTMLREKRRATLDQGPPNGVSRSQFKLRIHKEMFLAYDSYLDRVNRLDWLSRPQVAEIIRENLYHHDGQKYWLMAYCIMPNHVHVLFQPTSVAGAKAGSFGYDVGEAASFGDSLEDPRSDEFPDQRSPLAKIMHSLKSYTANRINEILRRKGQLWQHESYDHWVRNDEELERIVAYILANPVKAGLARQPHEWPYSSAFERFQRDGSLSGFLLS